ncbi:MAG: ketopantoate reductase family protein [Spirochaetia bacterium]|nr:ketopantoate reductase family protein [Spirochaetia bacterium]
MINRVSIVGLGAVGAIYASRLDAFLGKDKVSVLVDSQRKERYTTDGIYLNGEKKNFTYISPSEIDSPMDLIIIATKNNQLLEVLPLIEKAVSENTTIISLLNGIDSEDVLSLKFPKAHIPYSFATAIDSTRIKNRIDFSTEGIIVMGEKDNSKSKRIIEIGNLFEKANIAYRIPENIQTEMWAKYMVNVSINTISAITRANYGFCVGIKEIKHLIIETQKEVIALAKEVGIIGLDESYIDRYQKIFSTLEKEGKTSMLQDIEAKRVSENRWFCITASTLARKHNVKTPLIDTLGLLLAGIDEIHTLSAN